MNFQANKTTAFAAGSLLVIIGLFDLPDYVMTIVFFGGAIFGVAGTQILKEISGPHFLVDLSVIFPVWIRAIFWFLGAAATVLLFAGLGLVMNIN